MTLREFLADGLERIMAWLICIVLSAMFLAATGTQTGVILILFIVLLLAFGIMELVCFVRQRIRLRELEAIMDQLDQKYLFAECVPGAKTLYERRLFELMHRAGRAMIGAVSDAQAALCGAHLILCTGGEPGKGFRHPAGTAFGACGRSHRPTPGPADAKRRQGGDTGAGEMGFYGR